MSLIHATHRIIHSEWQILYYNICIFHNFQNDVRSLNALRDQPNFQRIICELDNEICDGLSNEHIGRLSQWFLVSICIHLYFWCLARSSRATMWFQFAFFCFLGYFFFYYNTFHFSRKIALVFRSFWFFQYGIVKMLTIDDRRGKTKCWNILTAMHVNWAILVKC